jgi:tRNA dimethylallyltransferase
MFYHFFYVFIFARIMIYSSLEVNNTQIFRMKKCKPVVVIIGGPTAVGKSNLSLKLMERHNGVLVNADATKLYRGLDCGANKRAIKGVKVRLWDLKDACEPEAEFSAGQYHDAAVSELNSIINVEKKMPIVVGGSGLYIRWLMRGKQAGPQRDVILTRSILEEISSLSWPQVLDKMSLFDPIYANGMVENDYRRAARAIELNQRTGKSIVDLQRQFVDPSYAQHSPSLDLLSHSYENNSFNHEDNASWQKTIDFRPFILSVPRVELYDKICQRCENMILDGLFIEVWSLMKRGLTAESTPGKAIGYRQTIDFLNARVFTQDSFLDYLRDFQSKTRQLAHRQLSWFRREHDFLNMKLDDHTADKVSSLIALSESDWSEIVHRQQESTAAESAAELQALRIYQAPIGLFLPTHISRKNRTAEYFKYEEKRQTLLSRQLAVLDQIRFEMDRIGFKISPNRKM